MQTILTHAACIATLPQQVCVKVAKPRKLYCKQCRLARGQSTHSTSRHDTVPGSARSKCRQPTLRTFSTGSMHFRNMSMHSSSNRALVMLVLKSTPSYRLSISMVVCAEADRVRFARSQAVLKRRTALGLPEMSFFDLRLNSCKEAHVLSTS